MYINYLEENILEDDVKEVELTKMQKEFIGTTFPTPKGGVLTVIGVVDKKGTAAIFSLKCSLCSEDTELWSEKGIRTTKTSLVRGEIPCGCALNPKWTERQTKIRVERLCVDKGYILNGWEGEYRGNKTKLDLYNPETGNCWQSTDISGFFCGRGDIVEGRERTRQASIIPDEVHIRGFMSTGKFKEETNFKRRYKKLNLKIEDYWEYQCPVCSNDEYVKAGVCSGVFKSDLGKLKRGHLACRCAKTYRWNQKQRMYQIEKLCIEEGLAFLDWEEDGYKGCLSKFKWVCSKGHVNTTSVDRFMQGSRCYTCAKLSIKVGNGFYPDRVDEEDTLYVITLGVSICIKVGRTFVSATTDRLKTLERDSGFPVEKILTVYGKHKYIFDLEQGILNDKSVTRFTDANFKGDNELLEYSDLMIVCEILEEICSKHDRFTLKYE